MRTDLETFLTAFASGKMVMVFDLHREEEADFFCLADAITPDKVNFLMTHAKGMICNACSAEVLDELQIPLMVEKNDDPHGTNFCVTIDAVKGITTGVSAADRARTIKLLANPASQRSDFTVPGHTFPLRAVKDYSQRFGHTEAAVALAEKVGAYPVVTICEILNQAGGKASVAEAEALAEKFKIPLLNLDELKNILAPE